MAKILRFLSLFFLLIWSLSSFHIFLDGETAIGSMSILSYVAFFTQIVLEILAIWTLLVNLRHLKMTSLGKIFILWFFYMLLNVFLNPANLIIDLRETLWAPLMFLLFYTNSYFGGEKYNNWVLRVMLVIFGVFIYKYFTHLLSKPIGTNSNSFNSLNSVFYIALLLPFAFFIIKKKFKYLLFFIGYLAILLSLKRSVIIFGSIILIVMFYYDFMKHKKNAFFRVIGVSIGVILISSLFFQNIDEYTGGKITRRFASLEKDEGSGRLPIYERVIDSYFDKSNFKMVFGSGHNSVRLDRIQGNHHHFNYFSAHNDFLEVVYDYGIIGLVIFLIISWRLFQTTKMSKYIEKSYRGANYSAFIIFVVMTLVSHLILYPTYFAFLLIIWAMTEAQIVRKQPGLFKFVAQ
ncbi:MAG TPA: O-antigen ligase family protein [Flavobacteriaceae bacterium]|nr:O-antigen ligase family protein [Flavobacteriaceae bacterium]